jgi:short-subunit dehydrogenase
MAKQFVELGAAKVVIAARRTSELERVKSECSHPDRVQLWTMDLSKPYDCVKSAEALNLDKVDILVNNGGVSQRTQFINMDLDTIEQIITTNTTAPIALCKALLPQLKASG